MSSDNLVAAHKFILSLIFDTYDINFYGGGTVSAKQVGCMSYV